ncbi:c-type cytochrome [Fluoribacter gormanii]|uniref:Cytochrome C oxidase, cbb3-type, subunit III n=1 Tax=Fluoribacter gormanii TaxID=464 RepID=A0A377GIF7_9GAMM|nr:c-type cytochrome [Fluoribacter gormanii]KTD02133.1 cytochrome c5 [Fluoribacter gormanii]MCW8444318.1 c-type cytochrome [Fluoribacter gormanii]MCW8469509.1 c-type cytochrome [Fluoribacter gormanii]SIR50893.1 Cytochrome C oxidase, cbb3-type, subunit III [Fluoribacter gormanii]STO24162.1 Cytochrome c5 [Fluoribacter gormanii]
MTIRFSIYAAILLICQLPVHAESHRPQEFLQSISGTKNEGEQIYHHFCANCHANKPLIPLGAPRIGEEDDWKMRLKQGMKVLFKHTDEGLNAMPARGGCFECTDKQLMRAIQFMLPKHPKK